MSPATSPAGCRRTMYWRTYSASLESLGEFFGESALRGIGPWPSGPLAALRRHLPGGIRGRPAARRSLAPGTRRLSGISAQQTVLERSPIKAADDGVHLIAVGSFDKSETFGFLSIRIADYFDRIGDQVFCGEPGFNIVGGHPEGEISEKYGEAHSVAVNTPGR